MAPFDLKFQPTGRYLSFAEREEIALLRAQDKGVREIARAVGRDPSTISRELRRNAAARSGKLQYRASVAQWKADLAAGRPKISNWSSIRDYMFMCSNVFQGISVAPTAPSSPGCNRRGSPGATNPTAGTDNGH